MYESIFRSGLRSFFQALCIMLGICMGILLLTLMVGGISSSTEISPEKNFNVEVMPNAENKRKSLEKSLPVILAIQVEGVIGLESLTQNNIRKMLVESKEGDLKDYSIKGILLTIASPGGTVIDADGIYHALLDYKKKFNIPVFAYVDGLCASGGMYISAAADKVYASDVSLIGSIGVISPSFFNVHKLINNIGVEALTLSAGKGKDQLNPLRSWAPGEGDDIQGIINAYYEMFVDIMVAARPNLGREALIKDYGAKVFTAKDALKYGFIDGAGYNRDTALKELLAEAQIEGEEYRVVRLAGKSVLEEFFSGASTLSWGTMKHELKLPQEFDPALSSKFLYLYRS